MLGSTHPCDKTLSWPWGFTRCGGHTWHDEPWGCGHAQPWCHKRHKVREWSSTLGVVSCGSTHLHDLYFHKCMPCAMCSSPKQGHQPWLCITSKKVSDSQNFLQPCHVAQPTWTKVVPPTWSLYVTPCAHEVAHSAAKLCLM